MSPARICRIRRGTSRRSLPASRRPASRSSRRGAVAAGLSVGRSGRAGRRALLARADRRLRRPGRTSSAFCARAYSSVQQTPRCSRSSRSRLAEPNLDKRIALYQACDAYIDEVPAGVPYVNTLPALGVQEERQRLSREPHTQSSNFELGLLLRVGQRTHDKPAGGKRQLGHASFPSAGCCSSSRFCSGSRFCVSSGCARCRASTRAGTPR